MTTIEELLEQIDLDEAEAFGSPEEWGVGVFEMPFSVAKTLLQIATAAFEMADMWKVGPRGTLDGQRSVRDFARCRQHIHDLKRELERVPEESA